ncbi:MAG: alpha/beta hydrolase [Anaerolineales bacterium]|jgi:4,5:9,10-diseco-3-hydroxy-5,9,17-trioxoandrosta-1(10),2-diene-4-oate hydrolase
MNMAKQMDGEVNSLMEPIGLPVILIHGLGGSRREWEAVIPILQAKGIKPLCLDLLGHGDNQKPTDPSQYHVAEIFANFQAWLLQHQIQRPFTMVGHSLGGYLALRHALDHPSAVRSLVLVDPFYSVKQLSPAMQTVHHQPRWSSTVLQVAPLWLVRAVLGQKPSGAADFSWALRDRIARDLKRASPHILKVSATLPSLEAELPKVKAPTLVVWGKNDLTLLPISFPKLVNLMPNAVSRPFAGCGHQPHLARPEVFGRLLTDFLISPHQN